MLALVWVATRAALLAQVLLLGQHYLPDVRLYATWTILLGQGTFPVGDPSWQYPPGAGLLFAASGALGIDAVIGFVVLALLADAALTALLVRASRRTNRVPAWTWVLGGFLIGPLLLTRFDVFPALAAAGAVLLAARHPAWAGVAAGIGALLKAWPVLTLGALRRRHLPVGITTLIVTAVAITAVVTAWAGGAVSFLGEQRERGLQIESVAALPYLLMGDPETTLRYGAFEIGSPSASGVGLAITAFGAVVIAGFAALRLLGRLEGAPGGDVVLALVLVSVATSRVFSPQYDIWIVAIAAAALAHPASRMRTVTWWLLVMTGLTQIIFPWAYGSLLEAVPYAVALQTVRIAILVIATIAACVIVVRAGLRSADDAADAAELAGVPRTQHG